MLWRRTRSVVAGLSVAGVLLVGSAGVAGAQTDGDPYAGPTSTVQTATAVLPPGPPEDVASATASQNGTEGVASATASGNGGSADVQGSSLAFTGGDALALAGIGLVALTAGGLMLTARRRRSVTA